MSAVFVLSESADEMSVDDILRIARSRLPQERTELTGRIVVSRLRGVKVAEMGIKLVLDRTATPAQVAYTIYDAFGGLMETVLAVEDAAGLECRREGNGESVTGNIGTSDVAWADLTFAFLWWQGGKIVGKEEILGRQTIIINVPAPEKQDSGYQSVKLWMDTESFAPLRGEAIGKNAKVIKTWRVKGLKRVGEGWMPGELEVRVPSAVQKTRIILETPQDARNAS